MATLISNGALRNAQRVPAVPPSELEESFSLGDFEAELQKLAAENQQLLAEFHTTDDVAAVEPAHEVPAAVEPAKEEPAAHDSEEAARLREENNQLRIRIEELEALAGGHGDQLWQERQREYEMLLEEKSEVIRDLHHKIHEMQESVDIGAVPTPAPTASVTASMLRMGQAEEILRLKREMDEQRRQLEQDEHDMMAQMRQMEMTMAKERAEMARQRQEIQRLQAELARDAEQATRAPELRDKLQSLRREPKGDEAQRTDQKKSSGFFRRIFG